MLTAECFSVVPLRRSEVRNQVNRLMAAVVYVVSLMAVPPAFAQEPPQVTCADVLSNSLIKDAAGAQVVGYVYGFTFGVRVGLMNRGAADIARTAAQTKAQEKKLTSLRLSIGVAGESLNTYCDDHRSETLDDAVIAVANQFIRSVKLNEVIGK
jgi:hypothetical protein